MSEVSFKQYYNILQNNLKKNKDTINDNNINYGFIFIFVILLLCFIILLIYIFMPEYITNINTSIK
jgi:uncharacterized membrane protein SpoIIM required for sporulation